MFTWAGRDMYSVAGTLRKNAMIEVYVDDKGHDFQWSRRLRSFLRCPSSEDTIV